MNLSILKKIQYLCIILPQNYLCTKLYVWPLSSNLIFKISPKAIDDLGFTTLLLFRKKLFCDNVWSWYDELHKQELVKHLPIYYPY
jgi:hypothetical protein